MVEHFTRNEGVAGSSPAVSRDRKLKNKHELEVVSRMAKGKYQEWIEPEGLLKLEGWARDGLTDEQISSNMGITTSTLYVWKNKYSEISEALKRGCTFRINGAPFPRQRCKRLAPAVRYPFVVTC